MLEFLFFSALLISSYNAVYNFIITNRNYGKTWAFKRRAFRRGIKHGKKTLWLRLFNNEKKEAVATMFSSADLQKFCGIEPYDKETKKGNFKQVGNTFYCLHNGKWIWFLKVFALSQQKAIRGADDVALDTIVFDEFTTTQEKYNRYRGNICDDFNDIFFSVKRMHKVRCFLLGNKENVINPFLSYFGIPQLSSTFEGIKTYRNGSIAIQQINNKPKEQSEYDAQCKDLFIGTNYGNFIYGDAYKNEIKLKTRKTPANAETYVQLYIKGEAIKISIYNGFFYCNSKIDITDYVYTIEQTHKFAKERLLVKRQKQFFIALINALADRRIYYDSIVAYTALQPFLKWLNV